MDFLRKLKPPQCAIPRFLASLFTLWVGIPRLPFLDAPFSPLKFIDPWVYGIILTFVGTALLYTSYKHRLTVVGRSVAAVGFIAWIGLAAATSSLTSLGIDITVSIILFIEVIAKYPCNAEPNFSRI